MTDESIEVIAQEKMKLNEELDNERALIIEITKSFIRSELNHIVEDTVKENPDHVRALGIEQLKKMKEALTILVINANALTCSTFADNKYWIHADYQVDLSKDLYEQRYVKRQAKDNIMSGIKLLLGEAGKLLIEFGFEESGSTFSVRNRWQENEDGEIVLGSNIGLRIPSNLESILNSYVMNFSQFNDVSYKLAKLELKVEQQEAMNLWNRV